jgi:hypothetical protein
MESLAKLYAISARSLWLDSSPPPLHQPALARLYDLSALTGIYIYNIIITMDRQPYMGLGLLFPRLRGLWAFAAVRDRPTADIYIYIYIWSGLTSYLLWFFSFARRMTEYKAKSGNGTHSPQTRRVHQCLPIVAGLQPKRLNQSGFNTQKPILQNYQSNK